MASNVTFIGAGNMASAIFGGMVHSGYPADAITATATRDATLAPLAERLGIHTTTDNLAAIEHADVVVLSVKPQIMRQVCETLRESVQKRRPLIVSVAAGLSAETLEQWLGGGLAVVRCMPNTPSLVGAGASGLYANPRVSDEQRALVGELMTSVGIIEWVEDEALLEAVTAVSGSAPAYFFLMFEAMEEAAVKLGLSAESARRLAMQTAYGAASMAMQSDRDPGELKRNVMSPGGTTERAIEYLEQAGLRQALDGAMQACAKRAQEMSAELGKG
ncbi:MULTISPECIES: pyrroline-5-carboxylate reductase [unclassified Halomonas]|jgi:pyrroline-5-carboxylate reductase|uniref:Pyrroline-5-carboxylate reductase n=1 Tax=Halomonas sp. H10-59 TaxID=2950874 RepID=A0AAU7KTE7_9GAMM|nr:MULTISPECIES: pyrroline-5-carboxylate reductase [unclassified Halomonas]MBR9771520.1 pyrroline-5-carboxylate reductase [Gammaproteobacteria bacterium]MBS8269636.1 pyrroline-5-carboxylate reductase [Halomonas litopenaei]KJZ11877.1 pyrroline-5-carboxylate reductase [Halomonas sp. S2151]MAR71568.1 pyrroline-5-carboxylate reductase [Halomonas sp.]MBR9881817.1 pyrroline-5-carboxylate reductase [Gammaproteobacteria bacterium]|tara:strand:+ start:892 stop:1716 length:825 start_codon:yes stop_codon:yes gene_type:complete